MRGRGAHSPNSFRREANIKLRKEFGECAPRPRIPRRVPAEAQEVAPNTVSQPVCNKRKERHSDPGPEVLGISVGGILKRPKTVGSRESFDLCLGEWEQGTNQ